jgi:hypothetical protein
MDEEDLILLRAHGVKSVMDFDRITDIKELNLPPGFIRHLSLSILVFCRTVALSRPCKQMKE